MAVEHQVQDLFDRIAPVYDGLNDWLSLGQHRIWKRMTVKWSEAREGDTCLDLCCGSGDLAVLLGAVVGQTGTVIGLDFAPAQLTIARQRSHHQPQIEWIQGDALTIPYPDNSFAAITMGYGLRNVSDIPTCLREIYRVLQPGKKAALLDFNPSELPWIQAFQQFYLNHIVVPVAAQWGLTSEYAYILSSLEKFPPGRKQVDLALQAGFNQAVHYSIAVDTMGVLVLTK